MARAIDWEGRIGRRLRLRDLHVFFAVVQSGSMAKAAVQLRVKQPSVSKAIGDLEAALGVRLFDRSPQGVRPTIYGDALIECGVAVFDQLKQGIGKIAFLSDPATGEVRIGCTLTRWDRPRRWPDYGSENTISPSRERKSCPLKNGTTSMPKSFSTTSWSWRPGHTAAGRAVATSISPNSSMNAGSSPPRFP